MRIEWAVESMGDAQYGIQCGVEAGWSTLRVKVSELQLIVCWKGNKNDNGSHRDKPAD